VRTRRRLKKQSYNRWRRQIVLSPAISAKLIEETKKNDIVMCVEASVIDAIRLQTSVSRIDAFSSVLDALFKIQPLNPGTYQVKVPATPVVYTISVIPLSEGTKRVEITLNSKVIVFSVDTLSSQIADEILRKALDSQS